MSEPDRGLVVMTAADVAQALGWDRRRAWDRMRKVEREHPGVIQRRPHARGGRELVGRAVDLARFIPELRRRGPVADSLQHLKTRVKELEVRLDGEVRARLKLQQDLNARLARLP